MPQVDIFKNNYILSKSSKYVIPTGNVLVEKKSSGEGGGVLYSVCEYDLGNPLLQEKHLNVSIWSKPFAYRSQLVHAKKSYATVEFVAPVFICHLCAFTVFTSIMLAPPTLTMKNWIFFLPLVIFTYLKIAAAIVIYLFHLVMMMVHGS